MKPPAEKQDLRLMREMFSTIAPRYDFVTRTFSYGMDRRWKRLAVHNAQLPDNAVALDALHECWNGSLARRVSWSVAYRPADEHGRGARFLLDDLRRSFGADAIEA